MRAALVCTLWLLSWALLAARSCLGLPEGYAQVDDYEAYDSDNDANTTGTNPPTTPTPTPILTAEAIANITVTGSVIIFLVLAATVLFCTFEKNEHKARVKTSLERNKQIDRQIAAEKHFKVTYAEDVRKKQAEEAASNVLRVRTTLTEDGEIHYEEDTESQGVVGEIHYEEEAETQVVVVAPKGNSPKALAPVDEADKTFVDVSLDSSSPLPARDNEPSSVTLVQSGNS